MPQIAPPSVRAAQMNAWRARFAAARVEYARLLAEPHAEGALFDRLEPFWVRQYKETGETPPNLLGAPFHGYSFCTDNPGWEGIDAADRTIWVHGRSVGDAGFDALLSQIEGALDSTDPAARGARDVAIDQLGWLRWDHFEALPTRRKDEYRRAEAEIAIGLGLGALLREAKRRNASPVRARIDALLTSATGRDLTTAIAWFEAWAEQAVPPSLDALCCQVAAAMGTPPLVLDDVLRTPDAPRCIQLMRMHLGPVSATFGKKRPRSLKAQAHHRDKTERTSYAGYSWPKSKHRGGERLDVGHLAAHAAAGPPDVNFFPQRRDLNRGWSAGGKVYRALERCVADQPGTPYFSRLLFDSAKLGIPHFIEFGIVLDRKAGKEVLRSFPGEDHGVELCGEGKGRALLVGVFDNYTGRIVK